MDRYYGFDLGDAESAVSVLNKSDAGVPRVLTVGEARSFVTAYARLQNGSLVIGEAACYNPEAVERKIRFKSRFLRDPESRKDVKSFAAGVLGELYMSGDLVKGEDCCFYVGCPAGWDKTARERYRELFEEAAYPPVRIISESRAALVSACQSKHFQVGYDILSKPVLVVDAGSSTTDFAYIMGGKEVDMQTAGEVALGGGIMDEVLLSCSLNASARGERIREIFEQSPPWKSYCEFAARKLKEKYFADEDYWKNNKCMQSIIISYEKPIRLQLVMDAKTADHILYDGIPQLEGKSFKDVFMKSLQQVRERIQGELPELVFLTGGVSKLPAVREWCREAFPDAVVITGAEPEFSVSRGLAWSGRIDEELRQFRAEIQDLIGSSTVERIVENHIDELYHSTVDMLVTPILENAAMPVFDRWRGGEIERLSDINAEMEKAIENYLHTEEVQEMLVNPITPLQGTEPEFLPLHFRSGHQGGCQGRFCRGRDHLADRHDHFDPDRPSLRRKRSRSDLRRHCRRCGRRHDLADGPGPGQGKDGGSHDEHGHSPSDQKAHTPRILHVPHREGQRRGQEHFLRDSGEG